MEGLLAGVEGCFRASPFSRVREGSETAFCGGLQRAGMAGMAGRVGEDGGRGAETGRETDSSVGRGPPQNDRKGPRMTGQKKRSGRCVLRIKSPHSTSEPLGVGRIKSVDVGAGLLANPRQAPEAAFSPSVVGGDVCEERFFRRFLPEQKAAKEYGRSAGGRETARGGEKQGCV